MMTGRAVHISGLRRDAPERSNAERLALVTRYALEVGASARIANAPWSNSIPRSGEILFAPRGPVSTGDLRLDAGAGNSACSVVQTVLPVLSSAGVDTRLSVLGLTQAKFSPTAEYLEAAYLPVLADMGFRTSFHCKKPGFQSDGIGELYLHIHPWQSLKPVNLTGRGGELKLRLFISKSGIARDVGRRGIFEMQKLLGREDLDVAIERRYHKSEAEGISVTLVAEGAGLRAGFSSHGVKGLRMEAVVAQACDSFKAWWGGGAACEHLLAELLIVPMALAEGRSRIRFSGPSKGVRAALYVAGEFLPITSCLESNDDDTTTVSVNGVGWKTGPASRS